MQQPGAEMLLKRCDVPADIGLGSAQLPRHRGKAPRLHRANEGRHQSESIHGDLRLLKAGRGRARPQPRGAGPNSFFPRMNTIIFLLLISAPQTPETVVSCDPPITPRNGRTSWASF